MAISFVEKGDSSSIHKTRTLNTAAPEASDKKLSSFWSGFLNYIFIGTETHRYHHSENINEVKNFGNTLAIGDIIFGTVYYKPGIMPESLGVVNPAQYPKSENVLDVAYLPFKKSSTELNKHADNQLITS